ncbi:hypothetical protein GCM10008955_14650 [Deinococcus malanensis]|uniref:DUF817 domain-containing protein n=1 Tax=Deinococcus malanensis TaxID=1706855 RepID=A0ABQ2ERI4_9DEIO|nr:DUF817 domain-containing protein [Deinococcus malanensis]GGK22219.1 hypothetical protein GCM10008955_14650 [Deinococcus malanensis]
MTQWRSRAVLLGLFVVTQLRCCVFALLVVGLLAASSAWPPDQWGIARYDALLAGCVLAQLGLIRARAESAREAAVVLAFHGLGFALEAFKVSQGSWAYPDEAHSKVFGVPLYAGFMYASVGSYMAQAWRQFGLRLSGLPPMPLQWVLTGSIYLNFFTHHFGPDLRYALAGALALAFRRAQVTFAVAGHSLRMPLLLSFVLIGLAVFVAENGATYLGAWVYPHQQGSWQPVHLGKWLAWTLLVVVAFLTVSALKTWEAQQSAELRPGPTADGRNQRSPLPADQGRGPAPRVH